ERSRADRRARARAHRPLHRRIGSGHRRAARRTKPDVARQLGLTGLTSHGTASDSTRHRHSGCCSKGGGRATTTESALPREAEPPPVRLRLLRVLPILLLLGLLVHFVLPRLESVESAIATMRTLAPWAIAMALLFETLSYIANGELLRSIVSVAGGRIRLARA